MILAAHLGRRLVKIGWMARAGARPPLTAMTNQTDRKTADTLVTVVPMSQELVTTGLLQPSWLTAGSVTNG